MDKTIRETMKQIGVTGIGEKDMIDRTVTKLREIKNEYSGTEVTVCMAESKESASNDIAKLLGQHIPAKREYFVVENQTRTGSDEVVYLKIWFSAEPSDRMITQALVLNSLIDAYSENK